MSRIAIPIFMGRVSPVLDTCTRLMLITVEHSREIERQELFLNGFSLSDRYHLMKKAEIDVIICCGISDVLFSMLASTDMQLICGIIGDVDEVLAAFLSDRLGEPSFRMPGYEEAR